MCYRNLLQIKALWGKSILKHMIQKLLFSLIKVLLNLVLIEARGTFVTSTVTVLTEDIFLLLLKLIWSRR